MIGWRPAGSFVKPVDPSTVTFTSGFGQRTGGFHQGIDLAGPVGTPIYAAADGVVVTAGTADGFGHWIVIDHQLNGQLTSTVYGHMYADGLLVSQGDRVRAGQHIANIGNDGGSTGPHLHFEIWPGGRLAGGEAIDPKPQYDAAPAPGAVPDRRKLSPVRWLLPLAEETCRPRLPRLLAVKPICRSTPSG